MALVLALPGFSQVGTRKEAPAAVPDTEVRAKVARQADLPPGRRYALGTPGHFRLQPLSAREADLLVQPSTPLRIGIHRPIGTELVTAGSWDTVGGHRLWRVTVQSPGATALRIRIDSFAAGEGKLWFYGALGETDGPYTGKGPFGDGRFWSATIDGEAVTIEFEASGDYLGGDPPFTIETIAHRARKIGASETVERGYLAQLGPLPDRPRTEIGLIGEEGDAAALCHLDVSCYPEWADSAKSVALITLEDGGSEFLCTGAAVATRNNTSKPYFLTASHCVSTEEVARTVEAFWSYQTSSCYGPSPTSRGTVRSQPGGSLLATGGVGGGDFSLLLLKDIPSSVRFSGWDPGEVNSGGPLTGIHHPAGSYKRISFGRRVGDASASIDGTDLPGENFYQVAWYTGAAEPGSSGSPVFSAPGIIAGVLSYGPNVEDVCSLPELEVGYGRFSTAYPSLADYLEDRPFTEVTASPAELVFRIRNGVVVSAEFQDITIRTQSGNPVVYKVRADDSWVLLSATSGETSSGTPGVVSVSIDPSLLSQTQNLRSLISVQSGSSEPRFVTVRIQVEHDASRVVASITPEPVTQQDGIWPFEIRIGEQAGVPVVLDIFKINGTDYSSQIPALFGNTRIDGGGSIAASMRAARIAATQDVYFEFGGFDEATGRRWYRTVAATFLGPNRLP